MYYWLTRQGQLKGGGGQNFETAWCVVVWFDYQSFHNKVDRYLVVKIEKSFKMVINNV